MDEIQEVKDWEKCINSLMVDFDVDIYLTGSNSHLLSSELATYLAGRYVEIPIYTLSFAEYLQFWTHYFPKVELLERIVRYAFDNVGNTFSGKNVADYFKSRQRKIDINTVYNYLNAMEGAFILYRTPRWAIATA